MAAGAARLRAAGDVHAYPDRHDADPEFLLDAKPRRPSRFVGLDNYEAMFADPIFWKSLWNNLVYAGTSVPISVALALAMALFVNGKLRGKGFLRLAYFTPTVLPMIAVANIWLFFYNPQYGLVDQLLRPFGITGVNWLGSQDTALWCLIVVAIWKEAGFFMIFYLAALQQISPDLREAAAIEGTSRWTFFWRVTFPLLMPTTLFVLVNAIINGFRLVDHIFVMTGGGPDNATSVLLFQIYVVGFKFFDQAYAATLDHRAAGASGLSGHRAIPAGRQTGPLPMSLVERTQRSRRDPGDHSGLDARHPVVAAPGFCDLDGLPS